MRVLLAGGGTAGHINPALAIAGEIKKQSPKSEILFAGTPKGIESKLVKNAGYRFEKIKVKGFQRSFWPQDIVRNVYALKCLMFANRRATKIISDFKPDIVIGTGGYVSGPIVRCAANMGIKTVIHEQNAFPGVTTKLLSKQVNKVLLAVAEAEKHFDDDVKSKIEVVGNPIRESILHTTKEQARKALGIDDKLCVLSFGGSLGAAKVNEIVADLMQWHISNKKEINHIHAYGKNGKSEFPKQLRERNVDINADRLDIREYIDNMDVCLAAADIVICRAGAITLSELEATGKASVLVPYPYAAANHQYHNAMVLQEHGAAIVIEEKKYDKSKLIEFFEKINSNPKMLADLSANAASLGVFDTREKIYKIINEVYKA